MTAIVRWSGQSSDTVADATWRIASTRRVTAPGSTRISGVPSGTSAAAITVAGETRCVPVTVMERTTKTRSPSSAQATPTMMATPASAKNAARQGGRRRQRRAAAAAGRAARARARLARDGGAMYSA